jgi:hypothetical protein
MTWAIALPWIFSLMGGAIFWTCAKHPIGWLIGVVQMIVLVPITLGAHEWGFISQSVIYSAVFIRNYFVQMRDHKTPHELKPKCTECGTVLKKVMAG